jgi:hypothetical protein
LAMPKLAKMHTANRLADQIFHFGFCFFIFTLPL